MESGSRHYLAAFARAAEIPEICFGRLSAYAFFRGFRVQKPPDPMRRRSSLHFPNLDCADNAVAENAIHTLQVAAGLVSVPVTIKATKPGIRCDMNYLLSKNANHSFPATPLGYKRAVLIDADTSKIRHFYALTDNGRLFFSGPQGVEKLEKLQRATDWISENQDVWAPVVDVSSSNITLISFADGRHTFVALEQAGHKCIQIAVPNDKAQQLQVLLACDT